ncbi:hypothetical protein ACFLVR_00625 [Chloroflexota bacterium]
MALADGQIVADGTTDDIMSNTTLLDSYDLLPKDSDFERKNVKSLLDLDF